MTGFPELWNALSEQFDSRLVKERPAGGGRKVAYITARTAANRLDSCLGFENWWDRYERDPNGSDNITCHLTIRLPDGREITKCDAGAPGNTGDENEDDKGAFSDAFKRAAAKFGIGRYLYGEGVYRCPVADSPRIHNPVIEENLPSQAQKALNPETDNGRRPIGNRSNLPRTGKALFPWAKDHEERYGIALIKYLGQWGKFQDFPARMVDWNPDQVALAVAETCRKIDAMEYSQEA